MRHILAFLAYVLPTLPLGVLWHLVVFKNYYDDMEVYREDILIPFGILSMTVQGIAYAYIYYRLFRQESVIRGAVKFFFLAGAIGWSFMVIAVAAKHHMNSVSGFVSIETGFILLQYLITSPLIALSYSYKNDAEN